MAMSQENIRLWFRKTYGYEPGKHTAESGKHTAVTQENIRLWFRKTYGYEPGKHTAVSQENIWLSQESIRLWGRKTYGWVRKTYGCEAGKHTAVSQENIRLWARKAYGCEAGKHTAESGKHTAEAGKHRQPSHDKDRVGEQAANLYWWWCNGARWSATPLPQHLPPSLTPQTAGYPFPAGPAPVTSTQTTQRQPPLQWQRLPRNNGVSLATTAPPS